METFGSSDLGAALRKMRKDHEMSLDTVARRAHCSKTFISQVETGGRKLPPWLASRLDEIYGTGNAISVLGAEHAGRAKTGRQIEGLVPESDIIVIHPSWGGVTAVPVPVSRRKLLAALGLGTMGGSLLETLEKSIGVFRPTVETAAELRRTFEGLHVASKFSVSNELKDSIIGQTAVAEVLRQRAPSPEIERDITMVMARNAELLSWIYEGSGDARAALDWLNRASYWAQTIEWRDMVALTFSRRAQVALNYSDDPRQAVRLSQQALSVRHTLPAVKSHAAEFLGNAYALLGDANASERALDTSIYWLLRQKEHPNNPDRYSLKQGFIPGDVQIAHLRTASQVLLGQSDGPIGVIVPFLETEDRVARSTVTVTLLARNNENSKLALAYAIAGEREMSIETVSRTLVGLEKRPSQSAWRMLHRTTWLLARRWPNHPDVKNITSQLKSMSLI